VKKNKDKIKYVFYVVKQFFILIIYNNKIKYENLKKLLTISWF